MVKVGRYRHFKGGFYVVLGIATHAETMEEMVLYLSEKTGETWAGPVINFIETLKDGQRRFTLIEDEDSER